MALGRPSLGLAALIFLAGSLLLLWFVILSAVTHTTPLNHVWFLRADTSGITGARDETQWAYFRICGPGNRDCDTYAAPAIGRAWSSHPTGAPSDLVGSHSKHTTSFHYFYLWRFGWVFYIITLFFETLTFFAGFVGCCGRLGAAVSGLACAVSLIFSTIAVSLMTATFVQARNAFHHDGRSAKLGSYAFGFSWASWACLFIATLLFCLGIRGKKEPDSGLRRGASTRSTKSFDPGNHRVKEEYA